MNKQQSIMLRLGNLNIRYMEEEKNIILSGYNFPTKPSSDNYYHINIRDDTKKSGYRQIKAKSLDTLKDKVYDFEMGKEGKARKTFKAAFEIVESDKLELVKDDVKKQSKQSTVKRDRSEYKRFFNGTDFEKMYLDTIRKQDIESICLKNLKRYDLNKKAYSSMKSILKAVFTLAYQQSWIVDNIYERVNFKKFDNMCIESTLIKNRVYSKDDINRMLDYIHEKQRKQPNYIPAYALELQICLGLRRGEVPPLEWNDIQVIDGCYQLFVSKSMSSDNTVIPHTKTKRDRYVPLTPEAIDIIERLRNIHKKYNINSKYLFPANTNNGCISYHTVTSFFNRMKEALNIYSDRDNIRGPHSFRRTLATDLRNKGFDPQFVANMLGHSVTVQNSNYYAGGYNKHTLELFVNR